jgi:hypothetical protein
MSMRKPVKCPNMATATPLGPPEPRRQRSSTPGCSSWTRNPIRRRIRLPEGAARKVSASVRRACVPDTYAASGPNREPGRILIPGDGAAGDQGAQNRPACPAMAARDACGLSRLNDLLALWSQAHPRLVTGRSNRPRSTWPNQARLALLAVTHRYKRTHSGFLSN